MFKECKSDRFLRRGKLRWILLLNSVFTTFLELAGLAIFLPLIGILTTNEDSNINQFLVKSLYSSLSIDRESIVILLSIAVAGVIILKNLSLHFLNKKKQSALLKIYSLTSLELFKHYFQLGYRYVKANGPSAISHNVNTVAYAYVFGFLNPLFSFITQVLFAASMVAALLFINAYVAIGQLIMLLPLIIVYHNRVAEKIKQAGINENRDKKEQWKLSMETFRGYPDILVGGVFEHQCHIFEEGTGRVTQSRLILENIRSISTRVLETGVALVFCLIIVLYVILGVAGEDNYLQGLTFTMLLFAGATIRLLPSVKNASSHLSTIKNYLYTIEVINAAITHKKNYKQEIIEAKRQTNAPLIEVKNLYFGFDEGDDVIKGISLTIEAGNITGIKGATGAGKSTLLYLLLGLYYPERGQILVNGEKLTEQNREKWHKSIGFISQDSFLLDATIAHNIALTPQPDKERLNKAIEMASLGVFINSLPAGADTIIGEGGVRLSGGERQRVAIARAFYKQATTFIMDEPTSALDAQTEAEIASVLDKFSALGYITAVIVSHSNTILAKCHKVIEWRDCHIE